LRLGRFLLIAFQRMHPFPCVPGELAFQTICGRKPRNTDEAAASGLGQGFEVEYWMDCRTQSRTAPGVQWFLARVFIARTNSAISRRRAIASAV
jgi:hypothetical protein